MGGSSCVSVQLDGACSVYTDHVTRDPTIDAIAVLVLKNELTMQMLSIYTVLLGGDLVVAGVLIAHRSSVDSKPPS